MSQEQSPSRYIEHSTGNQHASEPMQIDDELGKSDARLHDIVENLPNSVLYQYMRDEDGNPRFLYISSGVEHLNGVRTEDVLRDAGTLFGQIFPEYYSAILDAEAVSARGMSAFSLYVLVRRPDGEVRWMGLRSTPRRTVDGLVWDGVETDVTDLMKGAELVLHQKTLVEGINNIFNKALTCMTEVELGCTCLTVAEDLTQSKFGFIGEINPDGRLSDLVISDPGWIACRRASPIGHHTIPGGMKIHGLYGRVLVDGRGFYTNDPPSHPDSIGVPEGHPALTAFLGVPLIHEGKTIGVICLGNRQGGYRDEDQAMLEGLAPTIVQVFLRKRAEVDLAVAKDMLERQVCLLQRALIPAQPPTIEGYSVASAYVPAFAGTEIGGDFLDVFRTEDGKVGLLIGDVSGKGIESAALAATTRSTIRAFAYDSSDPGDAMRHANSLLAADQVEYMQFVTSFLVILDPNTGEMRCANAGHPPAIVSGVDGDLHMLCTTNIPLGVRSNVEFQEIAHTLKPGDRLILYTDGVTEARHDNELFGQEGIESLIAKSSSGSSDDLVEEILDAVKMWSHGKLRDDTAVLVVGRNL